ncbi:hypothetical protein D3C79_852300 [compost metagenome]
MLPPTKVSARTISRSPTRMSGREPSMKMRLELGWAMPLRLSIKAWALERCSRRLAGTDLLFSEEVDIAKLTLTG